MIFNKNQGKEGSVCGSEVIKKRQKEIKQAYTCYNGMSKIDNMG